MINERTGGRNKPETKIALCSHFVTKQEVKSNYWLCSTDTRWPPCTWTTCQYLEVLPNFKPILFYLNVEWQCGRAFPFL